MDMDMVNVRYMTLNDSVRAGNWITAKVRRRCGNDGIGFPVEILPKTGLSCFHDNRLLAVAFLYLEKSSTVAVCGWIAANPGNTPSESNIAVTELLKAMPEYARQQGATYLLTTFGNRGINRIAREAGFLHGDKAEHMIMYLSKGGN